VNVSDERWEDRSDVLSPAVPSVYRVRNAQGDVIYIGKTVTTLEERFKGHRGIASWWEQAVSVEVLPVAVSADLSRMEAAQIHRYHPAHNFTCAVCGQTREHNPLYSIWSRLRREQYSQLHPAWRDLSAFAVDVTGLLGERPAGAVFIRIDPDGRFEPGNVQWSQRGSAKDLRANPLYGIWTRLTREQLNRLYQPWADLAVFTIDVTSLLGERPASAVLIRIDPDGRFEPGNIQWGQRGSHGIPHATPQQDPPG